MMDNKAFREKYMGEFFFGQQMWYPITKEERNNLSEEITPDFYKEWYNLWLQTPADRRIIDDELTYGQYKTYVALTKKYGLGYYKHTPVERARRCRFLDDDYKINKKEELDLEKLYEDYDSLERQISGQLYSEMDNRLLKMEKKFLNLIKKHAVAISQSCS